MKYSVSIIKKSPGTDLGHYATSWKAAVSIPDGIIGFSN
jgi:hypothetical protein